MQTEISSLNTFQVARRTVKVHLKEERISSRGTDTETEHLDRTLEGGLEHVEKVVDHAHNGLMAGPYVSPDYWQYHPRRTLTFHIVAHKLRRKDPMHKCRSRLA